jgi:hypothetical protein
MDPNAKQDALRRQIEEARRTIREDWPDWMRRNRDAVHVPARPQKDVSANTKDR